MQERIIKFSEFPKCYPFVKWAGGKRQLLLQISKFIPRHFERYFEPFLGGGAVYFYLSNNGRNFTAYLSDLNEELINAYEVIKNYPQKLIDTLEYNQSQYRNHGRPYYLKLRATKCFNLVEKAARFITLNKTCFNGLYRVNKSGEFNTPPGKYKNPLICDTENLCNVANLLKNTSTHLIHGDYQKILEYSRDGDFIYLDPPYSPASPSSNFTSYTSQCFDDNDQRRLARVVKDLDDKKCKILLSNSATPLVKELYQGYSILETNANRAINSNASKRSGHKELLICNYF
jgi:DNA adenine methylase